jgi:DnaJ-domain-containing protein 1
VSLSASRTALGKSRLPNQTTADLLRLLNECHANDPDGVRLLEAYLDRRFPDWRTADQNDEPAHPEARPSSATMTKEEAYQVLGLPPGAGPDEVRRVHRTLMKKLHPDQGGSTYLAARVNQAKDTLLDRHS